MVRRGKMCRPSGEWASPRETILWAGIAGEWLAVEGDLAADGLEEAGEGAQGGGLAGAVGADEGDDLAGVDAEGDALDGFDLAVGDPEVLDFEQCGHSVVLLAGGVVLSALCLGGFDLGDLLRAGCAFEGFAEVGGDDAFVALDDVAGAFDEFFALDEDGDAVAEVEDEAHVVLDDEDGDALVADGEDEFFGGAGFLGVHAGGGLVEEEQAGFAGECAGDFELALFAVGEVAGEVVALVGEADELQEFHGAFVGGGFGLLEAGAAQERGPEAFFGAGVAADEDVFEDRHVGEEPDVLEGAGDAGGGDQDGAWAAGRCPCSGPRPRWGCRGR